MVELHDNARLLARWRKMRSDMDAIAPLAPEANKMTKQITDAETHLRCRFYDSHLVSVLLGCCQAATAVERMSFNSLTMLSIWFAVNRASGPCGEMSVNGDSYNSDTATMPWSTSWLIIRLMNSI